jgi:hypothetical protein
MSEIKTDKLTGVGTAGVIVVTGEGNSTTTNLQQGLAKAWVQGTSAAVLSDSHNIASGTDNGTGDYTYAFTSNMQNANYGITTGVLYASLSTFDSAETATGSFNIRCFTRFDSLTASDNPNASAVHGDLA